MGKNVVTLCFLCEEVVGYKVVAAFTFGGNQMLQQVKRMAKTLEIE